MLQQWIASARADEPVWLDEVSRACAAADGCAPVVLELTLFDGKKRAFTRFFPSWSSEDEHRFVREYLCACVFNTLSALGGSCLTFYYDLQNAPLDALIGELDGLFRPENAEESGYGKIVREADRVCAFLGRERFHFARRALAEYEAQPPVPRRRAADLAQTLRTTAACADTRVCCGVDVGGTDIKLAVAANGALVCTREYDWNPAEFPLVQQLIDPILLLTRLMRACAADHIVNGAIGEGLQAALDKNMPDVVTLHAVEEAEARLGADINVLDSVGLSFPDVVVRDAIVGGETPKTHGMRANRALDYETQFARLTRLTSALETLCRAPGHVRVTNDGNMAAYTAAMELAHSERAALVQNGVFAHSLGTDLGAGWLNAAGEIPEYSLELYDSIVDLGSWVSRDYAPDDLRCVRNENSGLCTVRRYLGQAGVFRMAWNAEPALLDGFTARDGDKLIIRSAPEDMRKPCLEHIMAKAEQGDTAAEGIFRAVGRALAHVTAEAALLLEPETDMRFLFGRFVKRRRCFELICEGFAAVLPDVTLAAADSGLACTPLMRQLDAMPNVTVAQFGQAVGAVYYGLERR